MRADDPRHGTSAGYIAGCREWCCWQAKQRYDKRRRWEARQGLPRKVSSRGSVRRVQSLRAAGWSVPMMAERCDLSRQQLYDLARYPTCYLRTHRIIADLYDELAQKSPPLTTVREKHAATKSAAYAKRLGYPLPGAWLDIDSDDAPDPAYILGGDIDTVVICRILAGDSTLARNATVAERREVVARWSGSANELARLTGWAVHRYGKAS